MAWLSLPQISNVNFFWRPETILVGWIGIQENPLAEAAGYSTVRSFWKSESPSVVIPPQIS